MSTLDSTAGIAAPIDEFAPLSIGEDQFPMELKMARKQITTVHLERQPHRDAQQRLNLAYTYLIGASQTAKQRKDEEEKAKQFQEVKS